jgi:hypothetical protein
MENITLTKNGYSILRRIVNGKRDKRILVVTFDSENYPVSEFDLHASECKELVEQKLADYFDVNSFPDYVTLWDEKKIEIEHKISAKIIPTNLGEVALEQYDRNEKRFRNSEIRSWVALVFSFTSLVISIYFSIF